jgi:hypothetical protein
VDFVVHAKRLKIDRKHSFKEPEGFKEISEVKNDYLWSDIESTNSLLAILYNSSLFMPSVYSTELNRIEEQIPFHSSYFSLFFIVCGFRISFFSGWNKAYGLN